MAQEYSQNIQIADLVIEIQPENYRHQFKKYGSYKRTTGGGIVNVDVNGLKLMIEVRGLTQSQVEDIKKRAWLQKSITFIDYVPISEKSSSPSRTVVEDLGSETVDGELMQLYIPSYNILIQDFIEQYTNNMMTYTLVGEEI